MAAILKLDGRAFIIRVRAKSIEAQLDFDDKRGRPWGNYLVLAEDKMKAFDKFHLSVPIARLEDFCIDCEEL